MFKQPMKTKPADLGVQTQTEKRLRQLPEPKEKIVAAIYNFRDKTGQYKMTETGGSWSTAVTQGASSILTKSLEESGWFIPIEREGLGNLLNERKIIRSSRAHYNQESSSSNLPPLLFAGIMLEGGIISYDHNVLTGGAGIRYFGAGGSGEYREDQVTVYLRAVSTSNGEILKTVHASKKILSQKVDGGLFRYVKFKRLLETELGFTYNEPTEIAVKSAIEKAVESLIIEGIFDNLWKLKNSQDINSEIIQSYIADKAENEKQDMFGIEHKKRQFPFNIQLNTGITSYSGDYTQPELKSDFSFRIGYNFHPNITSSINIGRSYLGAHNYYDDFLNHMDLGFTFILTPRKSYSPFIYTSAGITASGKNIPFKEQYSPLFNDFYMQTVAGGGIEFLVGEKRRWSISIGGYLNYIFSDELDGMTQGMYNDYYWKGQVGGSFYF
jgi:curli production assembly/transport component CsgG